MKIIIIRHAEPDYKNNTLTKKGFKEAKLLSKVYKPTDFDEVYCSPLARAYETCKAVMNDMDKVNVVDWLKEFSHMISIDGKEILNWDFYPKQFDAEDCMFDYNTYLDSTLMKNGNIKQYVNEVYDKLENVMNKYGYHKVNKHFEVTNSSTKTIAFFCHFGIESVLLSYFLNIPYSVIAQGFCALPSSVTTIVSEERIKGEALFRVLSFGDTYHLKRKKEPESFFARFCEVFDSKDRH